MTSVPPNPNGEPPLPDLVHCFLPAGFSRRTTCIDPDVALPCCGADWAGALLVVADGVVEVADASGESLVVAEGELFVLDGLGIVTLRAVGPAPAVLVAIERDPRTTLQCSSSANRDPGLV